MRQGFSIRQVPVAFTCKLLAVLPTTLLALTAPAFGQQENVTRFDAFAGYAFLGSPHVSLFENGFAAQAGIRPRTWYSVGLDYSLSTGDL